VSIKRQLTILIIATVVLASFFAALHGYRNSKKQLDEVFDQELASVAMLISGVIDSNATLPASISSKFVFQVFDNNGLISKSNNAPQQAMFVAQTHKNTSIDNSKAPMGAFNYTSFSSKRWRTYTLLHGQFTISVAQPVDTRLESAESILFVTITPIIVAIPIIGLLIYYIVFKSLTSLTLLSKQITRRSSDDLSTIIISNPPVELAPVIDKLNQLLQRVDASFEREKQLTANAAHELRTPVSVLALSAHNLIQDFKDNTLSFDALEDLSQNVDRMANVIEQMIALYRFTPEQFRVNKQVCNINTILQEVISQNFDSIQNNHQTISLEADDAWVLGEKFALLTLFENILKNAIKYSGQGADIRVIQTLVNDAIVVSVNDSGSGVKEDEYEQLFTRFYRAKNQNLTHIKGSGLGMSIVQHITKLHDGSIRCSKADIGGLSVQVTLPKCREAVL